MIKNGEQLNTWKKQVVAHFKVLQQSEIPVFFLSCETHWVKLKFNRAVTASRICTSLNHMRASPLFTGESRDTQIMWTTTWRTNVATS
jgi:hypothetical protein